MLELLKLLNDLRVRYEADGVKVFFKSEEDYCVKVIKNEKVIKVFRKVKDPKHKNWDAKKGK